MSQYPASLRAPLGVLLQTMHLNGSKDPGAENPQKNRTLKVIFPGLFSLCFSVPKNGFRYRNDFSPAAAKMHRVPQDESRELTRGRLGRSRVSNRPIRSPRL